MKTPSLRALAGFLVAPGTPALVLYLVNLNVVTRQEALLLALILAAFAYFGALVFGIPVHIFLRRKGVGSWLAYLLLGAGIGLTCFILFVGMEASFNWKSHPEHALQLINNSVKAGVMAVGYGLITGLIFWVIAIKRTVQ